MPENDSESPLRVFNLNPQIVRGKRGVIILVCAIVGALSLNCLVWIGPPSFMAGSKFGTSTVVMPPSRGPYLLWSVAAVVFLACSLMTMAFVSLWTYLSPPPKNSRSYLPAIVIILLIGIAGLFLHFFAVPVTK